MNVFIFIDTFCITLLHMCVTKVVNSDQVLPQSSHYLHSVFLSLKSKESLISACFRWNYLDAVVDIFHISSNFSLYRSCDVWGTNKQIVLVIPSLVPIHRLDIFIVARVVRWHVLRNHDNCWSVTLVVRQTVRLSVCLMFINNSFVLFIFQCNQFQFNWSRVL